MKIITTLIIVSSLLFAGLVYSHSGATGIVKERMDAMKELKDSSRLVLDMFKGKSDFNQSAVAEVADLFVHHGETMLSLFPETVESRTGKTTEALPQIWEQWDDFTDEVNDFISAGKSLKQVVAATNNQREVKSAFNKAMNSCKSCHKPFRKAKKK